MARKGIQRTRIKFCGICRAADAVAAVSLGVDALGFVLVPRSKRYISPEQAGRVRASLPPFVDAVALFQDADAASVQQAIDVLRPDYLQFHGSEEPGYCESFGLPYLKSVAMGQPQDLQKSARRYRTASALLLDSNVVGEMGGSGKTFAWKKLPKLPLPVILAGGLVAENVGRAVQLMRPFAVDVSSGIESRPGVKSAAKMQAFAAAVRKADAR